MNAIYTPADDSPLMVIFSVLSCRIGYMFNMRNLRNPSLFLVAALFVSFALPGSTGARADGDTREKHEEVLEHRQAKDILPFEQVLKSVTARINGEIIETEFDLDGDTPVYEFKYIDNEGRVRELYVNARTGKTIKDKYD